MLRMNTAMSSDVKLLRDLYERTYAAMIGKDEAALGFLHTDDFVLVHMTGMRQSKQEYITAIIHGTLNYYSAVTERIDVVIDHDTAAIDGQSRVEAAVFGGGRHTWPLRLRFTARRENGRWRMSRCEASTY